MILRRCVVSAFLVFFSRIRFFCFFSQEHFCTSQKNTLTKKRENPRHSGWCFFIIKEEISRRRDFLFLFFFEHKEGKKKIHSRQKESFHLLQKRARALKEHRHTHAHTKPEREREKDDAFFFFSDIVVCLFCVRIICEDHREREREKTFYHLASDKREEKTLTSSCF